MSKPIPSERLPRHIAVVMDGNGRWAKKRLLPRTAGHKAAIKRLKDIVECCGELGIEALTVFAFSSENWSRPEEEVSIIMKLFVEALSKEIDEMHEKGVQLEFIGDLQGLSPILQKAFTAAHQLTHNNTGLKFRIAVNYGGQWDILNAARQLAGQVKSGKLQPENIDTAVFASMLSTRDLPPVDLFIRTSGEQRISNFLLWQSAYAELYFPQVYFPAFDKKEFNKALEWFATRERRFGKTSEQLK